MQWRKKFIWLGFFIGAVTHSLSNEWLTPSIDFDDFLEIESKVLSKTGQYLSNEQEKLKVLRINLQNWKKWRNSNLNEESEYITIPQNIFHLFKKLTLDLVTIENIMKDGHTTNQDIPSIQDHLRAVVQSLVHLQYQYDLKPKDLMNEEFMGSQLDTSLCLDSCFFIGKTCSELYHYSCAVEWLTTCLSLSSDDKYRLRIIKLLYPSYIFLNQTEYAFAHVRDYLRQNPHDIPASDNNLDLGFKLGQLDDIEKATLKGNRICQGYKTSPSSLRCRYNHENSGFLKLAPLKEELLYKSPKVILYRDVIYDSEIQTLKEIALDKLVTSTVQVDQDKRKITNFVFRISQTAYIDNNSPELVHLTKRIEDIADLSLNPSEWWQVVNYAPGGFFRLHTDYLAADSKSVAKDGNRLTTLLFYLNNVLLGGETVFPFLEISVEPIKGSVLVWRNMLPDGSEDESTFHSACPVILGEKLAFTQWIRAKDQKSLRHSHEKHERKDNKSNGL